MNLWILWYRLRDAREGIARNAWVSAATLAVVTLALLLFGGFFWFYSGLADLAAILRDQASVRAFLAADADPDRLAGAVAGLGGVERVTVVTGAETFDRLADLFGERADLRAAFPENPFPDSLAIALRDPEAADAVVAALSGLDGVEEVVWGEGHAEPLLRFAAGFRRLGLGLGLGLLATAFVVTAIASHLALITRADEIRVQRLMGVSPWGIRGQFMLEGFLLGFLAALLAAFLFLVAAEWLRRSLTELLPLGGTFAPAAPTAGLLLVTGPLLGLAAAFSASLAARGEGA